MPPPGAVRIRGRFIAVSAAHFTEPHVRIGRERPVIGLASKTVRVGKRIVNVARRFKEDLKPRKRYPGGDRRRLHGV
jgi:hypothetical protein